MLTKHAGSPKRHSDCESVTSLDSVNIHPGSSEPSMEKNFLELHKKGHCLMGRGKKALLKSLPALVLEISVKSTSPRICSLLL